MALVLRRQKIRDTTVAILKAAATVAGDRVYPTRILAWRRECPLPAIGVATLNERSVPLGGGASGPFQLRQSLELAIECVVEMPTSAGQSPDDRIRLDAQIPLDEVCGQVTAALLSNPLWREDFEGLEGWETTVEAGRPEDTDRRTMAATILATINYTCVAEPLIDDWFCTMALEVDVIDPAADPNTTGHPTEPPDYPGGYPGPDGRIEVELLIPRPTDPPLCPPEVTHHAED